MHSGDHPPAGADAPDMPLSGQLQRQSSQVGEVGQVGRRVQAGGEDRPARLAARRTWAALAWTAGGVALLALFLRIAQTAPMNSDGANNALQAWDMLHGHLLLHGWIIGDATYYTFELPLIAIVEAFFGVHTIAMYLISALVYLTVAAFAVVIAVTDSRGAARAARAGVVVAVLAASTLIASDVWLPLGIPHHTGTTVFLLASCLLVDRVPDRRWTAPVLCLILCAGQIGDATIRYIAVPAIVLVCAYRAVAARKLLTADAVNLVAVAASVPLALAVRAVMLHFGAYRMVSPKTKIAPVSAWSHNAALAWHAVRQLFGAEAGTGAPPAGAAVVFGVACLLAAAAGVLRVLWRWRTARRAEQVLVVAIVVNIGVYVISTLPTPHTQFDIMAVLPCGAVLAARALVPARIAGRLTALAAGGVAAVAALLPLSVVAAQPPAASSLAQLTAWLHAHGLSYGLAGYWDGSEITLESGNQVQVRTVEVNGREITPYPWETSTLWFAPARHYANFVIVDLGKQPDLGTNAEPILGKPVSTHRIGRWEVLVYGKNLLRQVKPAQLPPTS